MSDPVDAILSRLQGVTGAGKGKWQARCPGHDDKHASLSVGRGEDGKALIHCHAGCDTAKVLAALGLDQKDLFVDRPAPAPRAPAPPKASTIFATVEAATEALAQRIGGQLTGSWSYQATDGQEAFRVLRFDLADGGKQYRPIHRHRDRWVLGDPPELLPLYNLPQLAAASRVYVCEGEKCVDAARSIGLVATTSSHGAGSAHKSDWSPLAGKDVVIFPDNDEAGRKYATEVTGHLNKLQPPPQVRVAKLPGLLPGGDIVDFLEAHDTQTAEQLCARIEELVGAVRSETPQIITVRQLLQGHPYLRPPVIHSLLRQGETMNLIAPPKTGKSWLAVDLAIAVASGQQWLGRFRTVQGDVLVIDNELHEETIAHRIPKVGIARGLSAEAYADHVFVTSLRGRLRSIHDMAGFFDAIEPGRFKVVVLDALYRVLPKEADENSNAEMAQVYNSIDRYADRLGCCFVLIHHSSKGNQSQKNVTDIGAGAGSQSRAADAHVVLRPHEEQGAVVFEAAVRSWPPAEPMCLRWEFPVWKLADDLDPTALRSERSKRPKQAREEAPSEPAGPVWNAETFTTAFVDEQPRSRAAIIEAAMKVGLSENRSVKLLNLAIDQGLIHPHRLSGWGNKLRYSTRKTLLVDPQ